MDGSSSIALTSQPSRRRRSSRSSVSPASVRLTRARRPSCGLRVAHFGDFGQSALRPKQTAAIGAVDLLFIPSGGGPTIGGTAAAEIALALDPTWVVPMHYRTPRIDFLETEEEFVAAFSRVERIASPSFETAGLPRGDRPLAVVPAAP